MKKEFGKWLMDVAKYVATAVLISSWFSNANTWGIIKNIITICVVIITLVIGLYLNKNERE